MGKVFIPLSFPIDLARPLEKTPLHTLFCMNDKNAHRFELTISTLGAPQSLEGCSVTGYFLSYETMTTRQLDGSVTDGKAVVVLDDFCYSLHGQFALAVQIKEGETETTVFCGEGYMRTTMSEKVATDDYILIDVKEICARIANMEAATKEANDAAEAAADVAADLTRAKEAGEFKGDTGAYYTPDMKTNGDLYWTPSDPSLYSVYTGNIKGPQGETGVGIESMAQITQSDEDGGVNTFRFRTTSGAERDFVVKNGSKGAKGNNGDYVTLSESEDAVEVVLRSGTTGVEKMRVNVKGPQGEAGYTPQKGTDYWTEEDKAEVIDVLHYPVTPQMFGAVGDGETDDTAAMQAAFDEVAQNGGYLYIPKGRYKVTSPITIDWSNTATTKRNFLQKIVGAGSQAFEKYYDNSVIVGYNIPANRAVIELIGNGNTWGTETRIEDLGIECDEASCDAMSFALMYGDARNFKLSRVKLRGYNGIFSRCGSIVDEDGNSATHGYEQMDIKFEQCDIYTFTSNTKGFAFLPEGVITGHYATMDNIVVDSCLISGVWVINSVNVLFQSCHIAIYNVANKLITTDNVGALNGYEIDYATGFYVGQAMSAVFQNCYFEDYRRGIQITPTLGNVRNVSIMNCYLNPGCNQTNEDGSRLCADYGIRINPGMSGKYVRNVLVQNNVFRLVEGDTEYVVANVSNECAEHFVFRDNCTTSTMEVPKVVNTTTSGYDIQNGLDSGASVKAMTTSADGKTLTIELTNGKSVSFNTGAAAPVKGVDYFTADEINEITDTAADLAKAQLQQIPAPTWVESKDDMTDTSKHYVLLETGHIWAYMTRRKTTEDVTVPAFTNLMDDPNAYVKEGYRYSLSGAAFKAQASDCAIVIPCSYIGECDVRVRGASLTGCAYPDTVYLGATNTAFTVASAGSRVNSTDENGDLLVHFATNTAQNSGCKYAVFNVAAGVDASSLIVTLNEPIAYKTVPGGTEVVTEWTDTGHSIVNK